MKFQTKKITRMTGLGLTIAVLTMLSGCANSSYSVEPSYLEVNGEKVTVDYVMRINNKDISLDEYRYYFLNTKYEMDGGDEDYWYHDDDLSRSRMLKENTLMLITTHYAVKQVADSYGIELSPDEIALINESVEEQISTLGGRKEYRQALQEAHLTDDLYRDIWKTTYLSTKVYQYCVAEDGPLYIDDKTMDESEKEQRYQIKIQALMLTEAELLDIEFSPSYDLISIETLR